MKFLCDEFFKTPTWLVDGQILRKLMPKSGMETFLAMDVFMMSDLLKALDPLQEHELILGAKAYTASQFLADLRAGIFSELKSGAPKVDGFRRNTQRAWVEQLQGKLKFALSSMQVTDARSVVRAELVAIRQLVASKARTAGDAATRAHLADIRDGIDRTLNPSSAQGPRFVYRLAGRPKGPRWAPAGGGSRSRTCS